MSGKPADDAAYQVGSADDPQERAQAPDAPRARDMPADAGAAPAKDAGGVADAGSNAMPGRGNAS